MMPDVPVRDVMHRTKDNLDYIWRRKDERGVWEVTQLVNSFLGALAHPWEQWQHEPQLKLSLADAQAQGWPTVEKDDPRDEDPQNLRDLLRLVRNAMAHGNVEFLNDGNNEIRAVRFWNEDGGWRTWGATLDVPTLRQFLDCFIQLAAELPARPPREPRRHIAARPARPLCPECGQPFPSRKRQKRLEALARRREPQQAPLFGEVAEAPAG